MRISGCLKNRQDTSMECMVGILDPTYDFLSTHDVFLAKTIIDPQKEEVLLRVLNITSEVICIKQGTVVAEVALVSKIKEVVQCNIIHTTRTTEENQKVDFQLSAYLEEIWQSSAAELTEEQKKALKMFLIKHLELFSKSKEDLGLTDLVEHRINTGDATPIRQRASRLPFQQRQEEKEYCIASQDSKKKKKTLNG